MTKFIEIVCDGRRHFINVDGIIDVYPSDETSTVIVLRGSKENEILYSSTHYNDIRTSIKNVCNQS